MINLHRAYIDPIARMYSPAGSQDVVATRNAAEVAMNEASQQSYALSLQQQQLGLEAQRWQLDQAKRNAARQASTQKLLSSYAAQFSAQIEAANAANEARYQQALSMSDEARQVNRDLAARALGSFDLEEKQQQADINTASQKQSAQLAQQMVSQGMAGSSVASNLQSGVERERVAEQRRLASQLATERRNLDIGLTQSDIGLLQDKIALVQSKEDVAPDFNSLINLLTSMGQATG